MLRTLFSLINQFWFIRFSTSYALKAFGICSNLDHPCLIVILEIIMLKLESTKKGFQYAGIKAWNNIPLSIRELSSLSLFKSHLKKHFMSNEN